MRIFITNTAHLLLGEKDQCATTIPLKLLVEKVGVDIDIAVKALISNYIQFNSTDESLENIATNNNVSPLDLYLMIRNSAELANNV